MGAVRVAAREVAAVTSSCSQCTCPSPLSWAVATADTEVVSEVDTVVYMVVDTVVDTPPVDTVWVVDTAVDTVSVVDTAVSAPDTVSVAVTEVVSVVDTPAWEAMEAEKAGNYQIFGPASCYFM